MTKKLKWRDYEPDDFCSLVAEAWASRTVGGKYRINRREGSDIFHRPTGSVWFEAERLVNTGPGAWNNSLVKNNPIARTIDAAKAAAEADNQRRLDAAKTTQPDLFAASGGLPNNQSTQKGDTQP